MIKQTVALALFLGVNALAFDTSPGNTNCVLALDFENIGYTADGGSIAGAGETPDLSGGGNTGLVEGDLLTTLDGIAAADFTGSERIMIEADVCPTGADPRTVLVWLRYDSGTRQTLFYAGAESSNARWDCEWRNGQPYLNWWAGGLYSSLPKPSGGAYVLAAYSYDGTNVYCSHNEAAPTSAAATLSTPTIGTNSMGEIHFTGALPAVMPVAQVAVYDRRLTTNEVNSVYAAGVTNRINGTVAEGLVGFWDMRAQVIRDASTYENDGRAYNQPQKVAVGDTENALIVPDPFADSLVAYFNLNGTNRNDVTGGGAAWPVAVIETNDVPFSKAGTAAYCDGTTDAWIQCADSQNITHNLTVSNTTLAIWVKPLEFDQAQEGIFYQYKSSSHVNGLETWTTNQMRFDGEGSAKFAYPFFVTNEWQHMAVVSEIGQPVRAYVNGIETAGSVSDRGDKQDTSFYNIGRNQGTGRRWKGYADEGAIWARALSAAEVVDLYTNQRIYRP